MIRGYYEKNFKDLQQVLHRAFLWPLTLIIAACGGNKTNDLTEVVDIGFSSKYVPPSSKFDRPSNIDPDYKILETNLTEPYWISALEMDDGENVID